MKGNQGLEALAALCGGQPDASTDTARNATTYAASSSGSANSSPTLPASNQSSAAAAAAASAFAERLNAATQQSQTQLNHVTPQQWSQALAAAATLRSGGLDPAIAAQAFLLSAIQPQQLASPVGVGDNPFAAAMQQLALQQYVQAQAKFSMQQAAAHQQQVAAIAAQQEQQAAVQQATASQQQQQQQHAALIMALAAGKGQHLHNGTTEMANPSHQMAIPPASLSNTNIAPNSGALPATNEPTNDPKPSTADPATSKNSSSMKPPPAPAAMSTLQVSAPAGLFNQVSGAQQAAAAVLGAGVRILPNLEAALPSSASSIASSSVSGGVYLGEGKKQLKRAANRRSAQLSRKRKKLFIEELKEENDELRRKEQILRAIPDLIVVFDSSGKLGFVSESFSRFFGVPQEDLEGTSFWDRLCEDSVRLLKAAFMDSLAARKADSDTAPLGSGVWELRLVDKNLNYMTVTLNGVVHFTGDAPECVCCIRPREEAVVQHVAGTASGALNNDTAASSVNRSNSKQGKAGSHRAVSSSDFSKESDGSSGVNPNQSVMVRSGSSAEDEASAERRKLLDRRMAGSSSGGDGNDLNRSGQFIRITDGDSVDAVSESCSDDGVASS